MSKTIVVPDIGQDPIRLTVNGEGFTLRVGTEATVPDGVAEMLENEVKRRTGKKPEEDVKRLAILEDVLTRGGSGGGDEPALTRVLAVTLGESDPQTDIPEGWGFWMCSLADAEVDADALAAVKAGADLYVFDAAHKLTKDETGHYYVFNASIDDEGEITPAGGDGYVIALLEEAIGVVSSVPLTGQELVLLTDMSSGGSGLPAVDSADDGKVLTVIDGAWDKAEVYPGPLFFRLTATDDATIRESGVSVQTVANAVLDGTFAYAYDGVFVLMPSQVLESGGSYAVELTAVGGRRVYTSVPGQPKKWELVTGS